MRGYHLRRTRREFEWAEQVARHSRNALVERGVSNWKIASLLGITCHSKLEDDLALLRRLAHAWRSST